MNNEYIERALNRNAQQQRAAAGQIDADFRWLSGTDCPATVEVIVTLLVGKVRMLDAKIAGLEDQNRSLALALQRLVRTDTD